MALKIMKKNRNDFVANPPCLKCQVEIEQRPERNWMQIHSGFTQFDTVFIWSLISFCVIYLGLFVMKVNTDLKYTKNIHRFNYSYLIYLCSCRSLNFKNDIMRFQIELS